MSSETLTVQEQLTPEERRTMLRAFADRMLIKVSAMDDPEDMPGVERAMRTAAVIERLYSRCDRAEKYAPDPAKLEAERANNTVEAIKARVSLAQTFDWGEQRRMALGVKWDAAQDQLKAKRPVPAPVRIPAAPAVAANAQPAPQSAPEKPTPGLTAPVQSDIGTKTPLPGLPPTPQVTVTDMTDTIHRARAAMGLPELRWASPTCPLTTPNQRCRANPPRRPEHHRHEPSRS